MKYLNRSKFGVIIGSINIFGFICTIIYIIVVLVKLDNEDANCSDAHVVEYATTVLYIMLVFCLICLVISGLLIRGLVQKRCSLMKPWIIITMGSIIVQSIRVVVNLFEALGSDDDPGFGNLFVNFIFMCIQIAIFHPIYTLYKEMLNPSTAQEDTILNNREPPPNYSEIENGGKTFN